MKTIAQEILMGNKPSIEGLTDAQINEVAEEVSSKIINTLANDETKNPFSKNATEFVENFLDFVESIDDKETVVQLVRYCVRTQAMRSLFLHTPKWIKFSKANKHYLMGNAIYANVDARFGKPPKIE